MAAMVMNETTKESASMSNAHCAPNAMKSGAASAGPRMLAKLTAACRSPIAFGCSSSGTRSPTNASRAELQNWSATFIKKTMA
jgi:hypothetical protein